MKVSHHRLPRDMFLAFARGGGGADGIRYVAASQYSKHLLMLRGVRAAALPDDRLAVEGYRLLTEIHDRDPAAARAVISYPAVGAWAVRTLRGAPGAVPAGLAAIACAAAFRAGLDARIELQAREGRLMLPSLGAVCVNQARDGEPVAIPASPGGLRDLRDLPGWQPLRPVLAGGLNAVFDDLDPFRMPTSGTLCGRLTDDGAEQWNAALDGAWATLSAREAAEASALIRAIVPYQTPDAGMVSSTAPESFGAIGMSYHPDPWMSGSALVHEVAHLKLSALLDLATLTRPDDGSLYYAPWRTDPRPAASVLQGAYAYLAVSGYWRRQHRHGEPGVGDRARAEFARWRSGAAGATRTLLGSGRLTAAGQDFATAMHEVLAAWEDEPLPESALAAARREARTHLARWESDNGPAQR